MPKPALKCFVGFVLVLFLVSQACATPGVPTVPPSNPNAIDTAIAETMALAATQTAQVEALIVKPTMTPTVTLSPTPVPTFTIVATAPQIVVTANTNCREGPGEAYEHVGVLRAGESAQVVGRSADAQYWIIPNPKQPDQLCWLSSKYATVTGVTGLLPVFTAPPP